MHVAAGVFLQAKLIDRAGVLGADEAHRQQAQVAVEREFAAGDFLHLVAAAGVLAPFEADGVELFHDAVFAAEALGVDGEVADFAAGHFVGFLVGGAGAEDHRPVGPGHFIGARFGRTRQKLKLLDALAALADGGAQAVGAGVAAAEDDDVLVLGVDELLVGECHRRGCACFAAVR